MGVTGRDIVTVTHSTRRPAGFLGLLKRRGGTTRIGYRMEVI